MWELLSGGLAGLSSLKIEADPSARGGVTVKPHFGVIFWLSIAFFVFVGGLIARDQYRRYFDFVPVDARVAKVDKYCYLWAKGKGAAQPKQLGVNTDHMDCAVAARLAQTPQWADAELGWRQAYEFDYLSPVDGKTHRGHVDALSGPNEAAFRVGQIVKVRASKKEADKSRAI